MKTEYKSYTIEEDYRNPYSKKPEFMFYPTEEGVQHDADYVNESYRYCGNCKWADSMEEAVEIIDEIWEKAFTDEFGHFDESAYNIAMKRINQLPC